MYLCIIVDIRIFKGSIMARFIEKDLAIKMRLKGASYSQIKEKMGISKSTLSGWLADYPLSNKRIKELRDLNPRRIENFRNTMRMKKRQNKKLMPKIKVALILDVAV